MITSLLSASSGPDLWWLIFIGLIVGIPSGCGVAYFILKKNAAKSNKSATKIVEKALADASTAKKEAILEAKEEVHKLKTDVDNEIREKRSEIQKIEQRIETREQQLVKREEIVSNKEFAIENTRTDIENTKRQVSKNLDDSKAKIAEAVAKLEKLSGMTKAQAKKELHDSLIDETKHEAAEQVHKIIQDAEEDANKKAMEIITGAVQKLSTDVVTDITTTNFVLPNDEVKGKIIGKEGRNIRALELATGVDFIVDDTPETISISSFDPFRREVARVALEKLLKDGRIHPGRIEEIVERTKTEIEQVIKENGNAMVFDLKLHGFTPEMTRAIGMLKYRSSYGQNLYTHSKETALLAAHLARELGANEMIAKRAGLLHDIGKVFDHEIEGTHTQIGVDFAKKNKEMEEVIHCIEAHHGDVPFGSIEAIIVQVADAISSTRPGARRENLENYIKRLRELEEIANTKQGVDKSYAISAGREIRVIVRPNQVDDRRAIYLAKEIAKEIEEKLKYPGQIKVNVIRETRSIEYAK